MFSSYTKRVNNPCTWPAEEFVVQVGKSGAMKLQSRRGAQITEEGFKGPLSIIRRRPAQVREREKGFHGTYITGGCSVGIPLFSYTLYTSAMTETASTQDLPFNVTPRGTRSTIGEASSSAHGSRALSSWAQAGLRFAASDQAVIEARARILDSHPANSSSRNHEACGAYQASVQTLTYLTSRREL